MTATETSSKNLQMTWTAERVDMLRSCVNAGLSCAQIAHEIGVSRNAVIGKINRLGLSRGRNPAAPRTRVGAPMRRPQLFTQRLALKALFASEPVADDVVSTEPCSLLNLAPRKCRWPCPHGVPFLGATRTSRQFRPIANLMTRKLGAPEQAQPLHHVTTMIRPIECRHAPRAETSSGLALLGSGPR